MPLQIIGEVLPAGGGRSSVGVDEALEWPASFSSGLRAIWASRAVTVDAFLFFVRLMLSAWLPAAAAPPTPFDVLVEVPRSEGSIFSAHARATAARLMRSLGSIETMLMRIPIMLVEKCACERIGRKGVGEKSSRPSVSAHATHRAREAMRRSKLLEEWARVGRRREGRIAGVQSVEQHAERPNLRRLALARVDDTAGTALRLGRRECGGTRARGRAARADHDTVAAQEYILRDDRSPLRIAALQQLHQLRQHAETCALVQDAALQDEVVERHVGDGNGA